MFVECYVPCRGTLLLEKKTGLCDTRTLRNISSFRVSYTAFLFSHASWLGHFPVLSVFCFDSSLFISSYTPRRRCSRLKDCVLFEMKKIYRVCSTYWGDWPCSTQISTCHVNYVMPLKSKIKLIKLLLPLYLLYLTCCKIRHMSSFKLAVNFLVQVAPMFVTPQLETYFSGSIASTIQLEVV